MKHSLPSAVLLSLLLASSLSAEDSGESFFETNIRPVLIERCFECHGQKIVESGLRVDSREALLKGGDSGPAIVSGNATDSLLIKAIRHADDLKMPPKDSLSQRQVADFERWIDDGALWPKFEPVKVRRTSSAINWKTLQPDDSGLKSALQVWYKADGQPWTDGQQVHIWEDSSGRGHDLVATAGGRREGTGKPGKFVAQSSVSGFPAVRFNMETGLGGNAATAPTIEGDAEFTMIVVARVKTVPENSDGLIAGFGEPAHPNNPGRARCAILGFASGNNGQPIFVGGWGNDAKPAKPVNQSLVDGPPMIITMTKQRGPLAKSSEFFFNGVRVVLQGHDEVPNFGLRDDLGFFMGRARSWLRGFEGDVSEVLLYNRALNSEERGSVETHLSGKFRIPIVSGLTEEVTIGGDPAFYSTHWAFLPVSNVEPPAKTETAFQSEPANPIDRFIAAEWEKHGLQPVEHADPRTLVRRLYFDLHGLPPTPEQMNNAVNSLTPWSDEAWAALIDNLLASPRYGERWGRHWLDVARYADTAGDNADYPVPEARLYRDYVIDAFNNDKPYDQFVQEQIAGDILADQGPRELYSERVTATGFIALTRRYATGPYELWHLSLEDTIDTVGQAFMGMTMKCARCHDHKFDPISQRDYYALYGIFESTQYPWAGGEEFESKKTPRLHFVSLLPSSEAEPLRQTHNKAVAEINDSNAEQKANFHASLLRSYPPEIPSAYAVKEGAMRPAILQLKGDPGKPGPIISRGVPTFIPHLSTPTIPADQSGRLQLARWLTRPDHPLTSRVMVNRIWQQHFGSGIVATPSNFGTRGAKPSHQELLDWLAQTFVENGWSVKEMHRLMLTSQTWRLSSNNNETNAAIDPSNRFLWRHERQRLDAESIRDSLLSISGRLNLDRPGEHPFPPITNWNYTQHSQFRDFYPSSHRSVYLMTKRLQRHPFLALFDGPDTNTTTDHRKSSIVPSQALYLMNSEEVKAEAEAFARRVIEASAEERVDRAYSLAFQRAPAKNEITEATRFIAVYSEKSDELAAWTAFCRSLLISHEAFHVD